MKMAGLLTLLLALAALLVSSSASVAVSTENRAELSGDRAVTQVVKLLESMLEKSKAEGDTERNLFAKHKCYCDTNERQKEAEIERLTEEIAILESKVEELLAATAKLSKEVAKLDKAKAENVKARNEATEVRNKENGEFVALEADLVDAIRRMKDATQELANIGADQTLNTAEDHLRYMAGRSGNEVDLVSLKSKVKKALLAASAFATAKQHKSVEAFLQAPFTGVYSAQSGEVVGILKDMRDTFKANLDKARETEAKAKLAYDKYMATMQKAWDNMDAQYTKKQELMSGNDGDLSAKRSQLSDAKDMKADAEQFLSKLLDMCAEKKKEYSERLQLRTQEQAAIAQAVSIINSDEAFASFGTVQATSSREAITVPTLIQIRKHETPNLVKPVAFRRAAAAKAAAEAAQRSKAQAFLQGAAEKVGGQGSTLLGNIVAMLQNNNPFAVVLQEIEKMLGLIDKEGEADTDQIQWCATEREETNGGIQEAEGAINTLTGLIEGLDEQINHPVTGLLKQIDETEADLRTCLKNQKDETADRTEVNTEYQKNIANLVEAQALLKRAVQVLDGYYSEIAAEMKSARLLQVQKRAGKDEPAPPSTWENIYSGQKKNGGTDAITMLNFLITNTKQEETLAHDAELKAQHAYEDSMSDLKDWQKGSEGSLVSLKTDLAKKQKQLLEKKKDLKKTKEEKAALEAYLLKIKPGCDYITSHIDGRVGSRALEKEALENARNHLKGSPVYKEAMAVAHNASLHDCLDICAPNEAHAKCQACLSDVSIPGYCAGHPNTPGC